MSKICKHLKNILATTDISRNYTLPEAVNILKNNAVCKFDETVEVSMNLNIDPRKNEQNIRGVVSMPNGTGKPVRVAVFARGLKAEEASAAGAELVGAEDLAEKIQEEDFNVCIATPDMMGVVGKLGKILGPKGLMPNPKLGTVTQDVASAIKAAKSGQVEYRTDKNGIVHAGICKSSFPTTSIEENIKAFIDAVIKARPAGIKGTYIKKVSLSTTMGVGLKLDVSNLLASK